MELKGSKTEQNLIAAVANESMANVRYQFYANLAKQDGYEQIGAIFQETAENEKEHAELFSRELKLLCKTKDNLKISIEGERDEWENLYPAFARTAREEGFGKIADLFEKIGKIESAHEKRFMALANNLEKDQVFQKDMVFTWKCRSCGHLHEGTSAPAVCSVCGKEQGYFELQDENY